MRFIYKIIFLFLFLMLNNINIAIAENNYFQEGKKLFEKKDYKSAKFKFEQDIVFNPKNEISYLYLAKIFKENNETGLEERNLKTVLVLNPKNEEALYNLASLHLQNSNFIEAKKITDTLDLICLNFCNKAKKIKEKAESSLNKK